MSILICYDGSASSKLAVAVAAKTISHDHVVLLNVFSPPEAVLSDSFGTPDAIAGRQPDRLERQSVDFGREVLEAGREVARVHGLVVECRLERRQESVESTILAVAAELAADLIVMGSHGHTAVQENLLGSVSNAVVRSAAAPVLIVPLGKPQALDASSADRHRLEASTT